MAVDDESTILQFLSRVLGDEGHEVETVANVADALGMVKDNEYALILLDTRLPGMSDIDWFGHF